MCSLQKIFENFNEIIKTGYDFNSDLKEKKDLLIAEIKTKLQPKCDSPLQGSYSIHTGVKPVSGDYDIDVALIFKEEDLDEKSSPYQLKQKVYDCFYRNNRTVEIKEPCVRVQYHEKSEEKYHVDFALYKETKDKKYYLARGKDTSESKWEECEPYRLIEILNDPNENIGNKEQYRRCVRYLKRFKALNFEHENIPSIAITVSAYNTFNNRNMPEDDVIALQYVISDLINCVKNRRIILPTKPNSNLIEKLTLNQLDNLEKKLTCLESDLNWANQENVDIQDACSRLAKYFGADFASAISQESSNNSNSSASKEEFIENEYTISPNLKEINISLSYNNIVLDRLMHFLIPVGRKLMFKVQNTDVFNHCNYLWKVRNIGPKARQLNDERGTIESRHTKDEIYEHSSFSGHHYVECYAVKDDVCIGRGSIDVNIQ